MAEHKFYGVVEFADEIQVSLDKFVVKDATGSENKLQDVIDTIQNYNTIQVLYEEQ